MASSKAEASQGVLLLSGRRKALVPLSADKQAIFLLNQGNESFTSNKYPSRSANCSCKTSATSQVKILVAEIIFWLLACDLLFCLKMNKLVKLRDQKGQKSYHISYKYKQKLVSVPEIRQTTSRSKINWRILSPRVGTWSPDWQLCLEDGQSSAPPWTPARLWFTGPPRSYLILPYLGSTDLR